MEKTEARRLIFMGTPEFGAIVLKRLLKAPGFQVAAVYTKPDGKSSKGGIESAVKKVALENDIPVFQPASLKDPEIAEQMRTFDPDYLAVASYGLILPQHVLDVALPLNVHGSLLPEWRGAAPIQRAILNSWQGSGKSGVSIMQMEKGLDTGPVYARKEIPVGDKNFTSLMRELAESGADLLVNTMNALPYIQAEPQDSSHATYAEKIIKEDGQINWNRPVESILAQIRALEQWPGAFTTFEIDDGLHKVSILDGKIGKTSLSPVAGQVIAAQGNLLAGCLNGWLEVLKIVPEGRKSMDGKSFLNGKCRIRNGICGHAV